MNTKDIPSPRFDALCILMQLIEKKEPLSLLFQHSPPLSPMAKELCFGISRHYFRLEVIAHALLNKKPKDLVVWLSILLGLYQIYFLERPHYAVVQETVALLDRFKKTSAKALVNAVLRRFCRQAEAIITPLKDGLAFQYGHPDWLIQRIQKDWPEDWQKILKANDAHPPMTLRINRQKTSVEDYLHVLNQAGHLGMSHPHAREAIVLDKPVDARTLPGFKEGLVSVQDAAAQLAVRLLDLKPGLRFLDACAAPGGKICHALEHESALKAAVAVDLNEKRIPKIQENLDRLQLSATLICADALNLEFLCKEGLFDRILLDAPCSATGVIRRHPDIKLLRQPEDIAETAALQEALLTKIWPLLAPGGRLVYATCSIFHSENEEIISHFLKTQTNARFINARHDWGKATGHGWQILPGFAAMDGFFYSVIDKI